MFWRNLVFLGLILGGVLALAYGLFPEEIPQHATDFSAEPFETSDFQTVIEKVNAAFRQDWYENDLQPAPRANDLQIARRASLALTGSVPSIQEIRQFESYDGLERIHWWAHGLLNDRRFADYFAERLARAYVGTENGPFIVFRRRRFVTWLSDQLAQNRPYDQLVRELISSNGVWTDKPATNFITVTIEQGKGPNPDRLASRVTRAFLGIRLDCAQCHDHPFQDWKQKDYEGLAAFFGQTKQGFTGIDDGEGDYKVEDRKTGKDRIVEPQVPFSPELLPNTGSRRERLAQWVTSEKNPYFAMATVNRMWALMFGKPLVEPVDDLYAAPRRPVALDILAEDFAGNGFDLRRLIQVIAATEVFQLDSAAEHELTDAHDRLWAAFPLTRLRPEQVVGGILQAASVQTINADSHIFTRIARSIGQNDFVERYGDTGEDEFSSRSGTIPQRLLMMNGEIVKDRTKEGIFTASTQIATMAPDDRSAVELAFLATLTRRPTEEEAAHFQARLANTKGDARNRRLEDLYWTLLNTTEFSWNH